MIKKAVRKTVNILDERKAENIIILDLKKLTSITDYFIIATANSSTHLKTLAKDIVKTLKQEYRYIPINPISNIDTSWLLLDYHDFIVHIFIQESREYYNLEELWFEAKKHDSI